MKRVLSAFLALVMILSMLPVDAMKADASTADSSVADSWDGKAATSFDSGSGTEADPYVIVTAEQLAYLAQLVNNGSFGSKHVILGNNIDLSGYSWTSIGSSSSRYFTGTFDGKSYTVSGLQINTTGGIAGLFGYTSGTIRNLNVRISGISFSYASGAVYVGAVAAYNTGSIYDVDVRGNITAKNTGNYYIYCGGIAGYNSNTIGRCYYNGTITANSNGGYWVGGIVGNHAGGTVFSSKMYGSINATKTATSSSYVLCIVGGIAGGSSSVIKNCDASIQAQNNVRYASSNAIVGGIVGEARSDNSSIIKCYAGSTLYARTSGGITATAGGLLGYGRGSITNSYVAVNTIDAQTNNETDSSAGWVYGGNTCSVTKTYYSTSEYSEFYRVEAYQDSTGSGCNKQEFTAYRLSATPSNNGYTGFVDTNNTDMVTFCSNTLGWGNFVSLADHAQNTDNTWYFKMGYPCLHIEYIYSLTVNYHKGNTVDHVLCQWMERDTSYSIGTPAITGYTADRDTVSGTISQDTIIDVHYNQNIHNLTIEYKSTDGKLLGTETRSVGYGDSYTITAPAKTGYTATMEQFTDIMGDEDVTQTIWYEPNEYTLIVQYLYADTEQPATSFAKFKVKYGAAYSVNSPAIEGYKASKDVVSGTMPANDQTITVTYGTNTYEIKVNYQLQDGTLVQSDSYDIDYSREFSIPTPIKDGYTPDIATLEGKVTGDAVYTVTYIPNQYTLSIKYVDGTTNEEVATAYTQTVTYGESYSVTSPAVDGYTPSSKEIAGTWLWTEDQNITVTYGKNMYPITIRYQYSDGTLINEETVNVEYGTEYSIASATISGYTPDKAYVTGVMPAKQLFETVTYSRNVLGSGSCGANVSWVLYQDGELVISGTGEMYDYSPDTAPWNELRDSIKQLTVEEGITSVGDYAFADSVMLASVTLPASLTRIGEKAFFNSGLRAVSIPQNVTQIGNGAFSGCSRLSDIQVDEKNAHYVVDGGALFTADKTTLLVYPSGKYASSYEIPTDVTTIAPYAFYNNINPRAITIPATVSVIGQSAFEKNLCVSQVQLSAKQLVVEDRAFADSGLETLIIEGTVAQLGDEAFATATVKNAYFKSDAPAQTGAAVFGTDATTMERLCLYYPLDNESWEEEITVASDANGYKSEYWNGYHAYAYNGVGDVTFNNAGSQKVYATFVYCDKTPLEGVTVTFGSNTKTTDKDGFAYFVYSNAQQVDLLIHKDRYISSYEVASSYSLKDIGVDYFALTTNSSVNGVSCYGNDISNDIAYINVKYAGSIPIIVKGNTAFQIQKMQLIQMVRDAENPSKPMFAKVLQTVEQGSSSLTEDGYCRFLVSAGAFAYSPDEEYPIYVRMYTDSGENVVVQQLRIKTNSFTFTGDFSNLLGETSLQLSDTGLPFLDGFELKLKTPMDCPLSFKVVNNEVFVTWDMDDYLDEALGDVKTQMEGKESNLKKDIEDTESRVKKYMTNLANEANRMMNQDDLFAYHHTADFSIDTSMAGGFCFTLGEKNNLQTIQSYLKLALEMKASWTVDMLIIIVPVTLEIEATATGEVEIRGLGFDFQNCKVLMPEVTLSTEISLKVSLGLGCRVLSAGVFGRISLKASIVLGETSYFDGLILTGEFGIYAKLDVGLFSLYGEKAWQFMEVELIPKSAAEKLQADKRSDGYMGQYNGLPVYELSSYKLRTRHIDIDDVQWATDASLTIEQESYEHAKPQLVNHNGMTMMVYVGLHQGRSDYNAQALIYRQYDEKLGDWTDPIFVEDDGTSDSSFALAEYNGTLYVLYTEASKEFTQEDVAGKTDEQVMMEISRSQEVVLAAYNAEANRFEVCKTFTNDQCFDMNPVIDVIDGKLYAGWSTNTGDGEAMVFGMNSDNQVYVCSFDGESWTEPKCVVTDCNPISEMKLAELDGKAHVAMVIDEDANYYSGEDSNIYIADEDGNVTFVDCYGDTVGNLQTCVYQQKPALVWYCSGGLKKLTSVAEAPVVFLEQSEGITQDYRLTNLADDVLALSWNVKNIQEEGQTLEKSVVYKKLIDGANPWIGTSVAFQAPYYMMGYDMVGYNGDMRFVYTNTQMVFDETAKDFIMCSKLCSNFQTTDYALQVGQVSNATVDTQTGKVSMDVELTNNGLKTVTQVSVMLKQKSATTGLIERYIAVGLYQVDIAVDETETVHFEADVIDNVDLAYADIVIKPYEDTEEAFQAYVDSLNESLEGSGETPDVGIAGNEGASGDSIAGGTIIEIIVPGAGGAMTPASVYPNLKVEGEYLVVGDTEYLSVKVTNTGKVDGAGMLNVARLADDGQTTDMAVYNANIIDLAPNAIKYYLVELQDDVFDSSSEDFKCWISHYSYGDDEADNTVVLTATMMENGSGAQYDLDAVASELSSYNEVFDKNSTQDLQLSVTLNGNEFVGVRDKDFANNSTFVPNEDETVLEMTTKNEYLQTLEVGVYEQQFLFLTERGYIDCVLNLTVQDTTPIGVTGDIAIVGVPKRGQRLSVDISGLNTDELAYSWRVGGEEVSTEIDYIIESGDLGKDLSVTVSGTGLYQGSATDSVYVDKVERTVKTPTVTVLDSEYAVQLKTGFVVGDGAVEYGWATTNDPSRVSNWSTDNTLTFTKDDLYYLFVRVTGSEIYQDAVSEAVTYSPKEIALEITTVTLRPSRAAVYFKGDFYIDEGVEIKRKGIVLSLYSEQPLADGTDPSSLCTEGYSSVTVVNIINDQKALAQNLDHADMQIYARAYVELADGSYVYSDTVHMSLREVVQIVDARWTKLTDGQKEAMKAMYASFKEILDQWQLKNVCA